MDLQLSVLVRTDVDGRHVRLVVTGCLTDTNQRVLYPLIRRARALTSDTAVLVDLSSVQTAEVSVVDLLRWATEHEDRRGTWRPVGFLLPAAVSARPSGTGTGGRSGGGVRP